MSVLARPEGATDAKPRAIKPRLNGRGAKEEGEANLLLAQGRMERSGMAPWVSRTTHKNNALQGQKQDYQ